MSEVKNFFDTLIRGQETIKKGICKFKDNRNYSNCNPKRKGELTIKKHVRTVERYQPI
jgi:hypothetical protein